MQRTDNIIQWNCRGLRANFPELQRLITNTNPIAICLQETKLPVDTRIDIRGYSAYHCHSTGTDGLSGGTSIFVPTKILHTEVKLTTRLQAVAIRLTAGKTTTICSIYLPPSLSLKASDLNDLIDQLPTPFILMGDFNAHNPIWGSSTTSPRGRMLEKLLSDTDIFLLNDNSPTYVHPATTTFSNLDLTLIHPSISTDYSWSVLDSLHGSDHFPILLSSILPAVSSNPSRWNFTRADWTEFQTLCSTDLTSDKIDSPEQFLECLIEIAENCIPKTSTRPRKDNPWFNEDCRRAIAAREAAFKDLLRRPSNINLTRFRMQRAKARRIIRESKRDSWRRYVSKINNHTPVGKVWRMVDKIKGKKNSTGINHLIKQNGDVAEEEEDVANVLGGTFAANSSSNHYSTKFQNFKARTERSNIDFSDRDNHFYNTPFSMQELTSSLLDAGNTAPGPDQIHNEILRHLPPPSLECLLKIYNEIWNSGTFPTSWQKAHIVPIPKAKKDLKNPLNYRPIALTSCLCKLMERLVNNRLTWYLETSECLSPYQCGFRTGRSTTDNLVRLETFIRESFICKHDLVAVFFDLEKAFDTTWKHGILQDLYELGLRGNLPIFIENFLSNRLFQVRVNSTLSDEFSQEQGVPQGSVISPTLFNIKINSITNTLRQNTDCSLYVDDFLVCYRASSLSIIERHLQLQLNALQDWADVNGFKFSPQKTVAVHFSKKRNSVREPDLYLDKNHTARIPVREEARFLGVVFDRKLTFLPHIKQLKASCQGALNILKTISGADWGADRISMLRLYRSLIRSKLDYGCIVYGSAKPCHLKILNPIHNQGLRLSLGAFRTSPVESLYVEANEPSLSDRRDKLSLQYALNVISRPDNPAYISIIEPGFRDKFLTTPSAIPTFGVRVGKLLNSAGIDVGVIEERKLPRSPPWQLTRPKVILNLADSGKSYTSPEVYKAQLGEVMMDFPRHTRIYTDGSKEATSVGAAAYSELGMRCCGMDPHCSIFTAESVAIHMALDLAEKSAKSAFIILSDSLSCLKAIHGFNTKIQKISNILQRIDALSNRGKEVVFCWIPSHIGISGNERADELAKVATEIEPSLSFKVPSLDFRSSINKFVIETWQSRWDGEIENKLRKIEDKVGKHPGISKKRRRDEIVLARLRIGHSHLTHSYLLKGEDPPRCVICNCTITIKHILLDCPDFAQSRSKFYHSQTLKGLFSLDELAPILSFLKDIGIYDKI